MNNPKTSLKIDVELNKDLMILSRLINTTKEELADKILREGIAPLLINLVKQRFR